MTRKHFSILWVVLAAWTLAACVPLPSPTPTPPSITRFDSDPQASVRQGQCVNLSWDVQGEWDDDLVLRVNGNQVTGGTGTYSYQDCECPQNIGTCKYELHVSGPGGEDNDALSVEVIE